MLLAVWLVAEGAESRGVWWVGRGKGFCYLGAVPAFVINVACAVELGGNSVFAMVRLEDFVGELDRGVGPLRGVVTFGAVLITAFEV